MAFEQQILNDVWDPNSHQLRTSGGVVTNAQTVISYNAAGDVVKVEQTENGITQEKTFSNIDTVVASTKTISPWSQV